MTTATDTPTAAPSAAPTKPLPSADLDTRLMLASIGLDVTLDHAADGALAEANAAATAAILEAQSTPDPRRDYEPHPVLQRAAQLIRERGWVQGVYTAPGGSLCAMAAIREVLYGPMWAYAPSDQRERDAAGELMRRIKNDTGVAFSVPKWNDTRSSEADVLRLLG